MKGHLVVCGVVDVLDDVNLAHVLRTRSAGATAPGTHESLERTGQFYAHAASVEKCDILDSESLPRQPSMPLPRRPDLTRSLAYASTLGASRRNIRDVAKVEDRQSSNVVSDVGCDPHRVAVCLWRQDSGRVDGDYSHPVGVYVRQLVLERKRLVHIASSLLSLAITSSIDGCLLDAAMRRVRGTDKEKHQDRHSFPVEVI